MDPITLIVAALTTGATLGIQGTVNEAVKDSYTSLKTLIHHKFASKPNAELAFIEHENDPEVWEIPLKDALMEVHADQDQKIVEAAKELMEQANPQQGAVSRYNVQINGNIQGLAQGDYQQITMNFGNEPKEK